MTEIEKDESQNHMNKISPIFSDKLTFDNVYGELEYYKKKCEILEKDLFKSQTQIKKLEVNLKKTQEINSIYGKNMNNTSISFLLPSEFKTLWESLCQDQLLEAFDCLYDDYINLSHVAHDILKITYEETKEFIKEKINSVLKVLNIDKQYKEKNMINEEKFQVLFKSIFQDYFSQIFEFTDDFSNRIKQKLIQKVNEYSNSDNKDNKNMEDILDDFIDDLNKNPFKNLIQNLFKLCMYMLLHDPVLTFDIPSHKERKLNYFFYDKNNHLNIEGFGNEDTPCLIIIPSPLINSKHVYLGIKPAVYCLQKSLASQEILIECEKNKNISNNNNINNTNSNSHHRHNNSNADLSQFSHHTNNDIISNEKLTVTPTKLIPVSKLNTATPLKIYGNNSNTNSSIIGVSTQNNSSIPSAVKNANNTSMIINSSNNLSREKEKEMKQKEKENKNSSIIKMESEKYFVQEKSKGEKAKINSNRSTIETYDPPDKKNYDRPLAYKSKPLEEIKIQPRNKISAKASFISQDNTYTATPSKSNAVKSGKVNNSRGSSFNESIEQTDSKTIKDTNLNNYNKSSRSINQNILFQHQTSNTNDIIKTIPLPTNTNKSSATDNGFEVVRTKNTQTNYIDDKLPIRKSENNFNTRTPQSNLIQKDTKYSTNIKPDRIIIQKDIKQNNIFDDLSRKFKNDLPLDEMNSENISNLEKQYRETMSPTRKLRNNNTNKNEFAYTNVNNISRKNNYSEKSSNDKFSGYTMNLSSLNRLTPKEYKFEQKIEINKLNNKEINVFDTLNKKNNKTIDDKLGNYPISSKMNRIGDNLRRDDNRINSKQTNPNFGKYNDLAKENSQSICSKTQKLDFESLIGGTKISNTQVKSKIQKVYNVLVGNYTDNTEEVGAYNSKNMGFANKLEKK